MTDLSFVKFPWWHMIIYLNLITLIYERDHCKLGYFPWGFSESEAFSASSLSERGFTVVYKDHHIFQGICGTRVMALAGSDACVDYFRWKNYCIILLGVHRPFTIYFLMEVFALNSLIFSGRANAI